MTSIFKFVFIVFFAGCSSLRVSKPTNVKFPNILFIISDDLSAAALGTYGNTQCLTPNIDQLAARGIQFNRAYSQYPVCGPSRAALMAGMYPQKLGIMNNQQSRLFDAALGLNPSMPEYFRNNQYKTTRLGKIYHMRVPGDITAGVDGPDHAESWDNKFNFKGPEWMTKGAHRHVSNEKLKFEPNVHYNLGFGQAFYVVEGEGDGSEQPDFRATSKAIEILEDHHNNTDMPFFLAVGYIRPHVPLVAPASEYKPYPHDQISLPQKIKDDLEDIPQMGIPKTSKSFGIQDIESQQDVLSAYYASVSFMDRQIGRLLTVLQNQGLLENTIVVFTSDHGYHLGEHDFWQKLSLHEESTRIPIIMAGPGIKVSRTESLAEQIDIYPTLVDLVGLPPARHVQGKSLLPVIDNPDKRVRNSAYCVTNKGAMIRTAGWTYIQYSDQTEELYDMTNDIGQYNNLIHDSRYQNDLMDLRKRMEIRKRQATASL